jgi:hypothetical protein
MLWGCIMAKLAMVNDRMAYALAGTGRLYLSR